VYTCFRCSELSTRSVWCNDWGKYLVPEFPWGTMLQTRRSPIRVQDEVDFFNLPNPSSPLWPWVRLSFWHKWIPGIFLGVKSGRRVRLTNSPPSVSRISENVGASTSCNPKDLHGLYRDNFTITYTFIQNLLSLIKQLLLHQLCRNLSNYWDD
jgi:hypothetical protein